MPVIKPSFTAASSIVWDNWASTSTTSTGTDDVVWRFWNDASTSSTTAVTTTNDVWNQWVTLPKPYVAPPISQEERQRRADEAAKRAKQREEAARLKQLASERATTLLRGVLDEQQRNDLAAHGHFFVSAQGGNLYRIDKGRAGNVRRVHPQTRRVEETLCVHQQAQLPIADTMLMQKLLIETNEKAIRDYANITSHIGNPIKHCERGLLTGDKLAQIIPFRVAA